MVDFAQRERLEAIKISNWLKITCVAIVLLATTIFIVRAIKRANIDRGVEYVESIALVLDKGEWDKIQPLLTRAISDEEIVQIKQCKGMLNGPIRVQGHGLEQFSTIKFFRVFDEATNTELYTISLLDQSGEFSIRSVSFPEAR